MDLADARPGRALTAVCVVGVAALTALALTTRDRDGGLFAADVLAGVAACALVPVVLRWPVPGALATAVLAAVSPAATPAATAATLIAAQRRRLPVAIGVGLAGVAAHAVQALLRPIEGLPYGWWLLLDVIAHAALVAWGTLARTRRALLAALAERARRAEVEQAERIAAARAEERTRIAREMHDVLAHRLSLLATYAGALEYRPDAAPERLAHAAGIVRDGVHQALDELRAVIGVLRAGEVDGGAPQPVLADLPELVDGAGDAGTPVELDLGDLADPAGLPTTTGRTAYRIAQEGLTNAHRHAPGLPVRMRVAGGPGAGLEITLCNPLPDRPPEASHGSGTGLVGLAERAELVGGELSHRRTDGEFRLRAWLPWET